MLLYGYGKRPMVLLPRQSITLTTLETKYAFYKNKGLVESDIRRKMQDEYTALEHLRDLTLDFHLTTDRDDALEMCSNKKEGYLLAINIPDDLAQTFAREPITLLSGKEVSIYHVPARTAGELILDKKTTLEFLPLVKLREHAREKEVLIKTEKEGEVKHPKETFVEKIVRITHRNW